MMIVNTAPLLELKVVQVMRVEEAALAEKVKYLREAKIVMQVVDEEQL